MPNPTLEYALRDSASRKLPTRSGCEAPAARRVVYGSLLLGLGLVTGFAVVYRPFDLNIYLWGGRAVQHGLRLYLVQSHANWFTYPPFAATLFTPMAGVPGLIARLAWELASVAAFAWACVLTLKLAGYRPSRTTVAAMVAGGLLLEPIYHTLYLGQVNLLLLALILADVWRVSQGRRAGIAVGIAAAIKLTPAIFIVLFLLTGRIRDALRAVAAFVACGLIGYLVDPSASRLYWTHLFDETKRVPALYISNQSPYASIARIMGGTGHVGTWFLLVAMILGAAGLVIAVALARRRDWLGAAVATGTTSLLVSPISWTHHWVWITPALVVLVRGGTRARIAAACSFLLFALAPMWWTPRHAALSEFGWHGLTTLIANCFLLSGLVFMGYLAYVAVPSIATSLERARRRVRELSWRPRVAAPGHGPEVPVPVEPARERTARSRPGAHLITDPDLMDAVWLLPVVLPCPMLTFGAPSLCGERVTGFKQSLEAGNDLRPAATDHLRHRAARVEAVMDNCQLDVLPGWLDVEAHLRPALVVQPCPELLIPAEPRGEFWRKSVPGVGQPAVRLGFKHDLLGVADQHAVVVPGHRRP